MNYTPNDLRLIADAMEADAKGQPIQCKSDEG